MKEVFNLFTFKMTGVRNENFVTCAITHIAGVRHIVLMSLFRVFKLNL